MNHWSAIRMVAQREVRERLRSKVFRASTIISALVVIAIIVIPNLRNDKVKVYDVGLVGVTNPVVNQAVRSSGPAVGAVLRIHEVSSIDVALADKVFGAGAETGRAVTIEWEPVQQLNSWRYGLATATGMLPPERLINDASPTMRATPATTPSTRARRASGFRPCRRGDTFAPFG